MFPWFSISFRSTLRQKTWTRKWITPNSGLLVKTSENSQTPGKLKFFMEGKNQNLKTDWKQLA